MDAANYSAIERLSNGSGITIRALRPEDRDDFTTAVRRTSAESLYRRFFAPRREFSEREASFFMDIDFIAHVALIAVDEAGEHATIVGGGRYVVGAPGCAELAFMVVDQYQGRGIGAALLRHLIAIARKSDLRELTADVLSDNAPMLRILEKAGFSPVGSRERGTKQLMLQLT